MTVVQASHEMHRSYFGEGLTLLGERLLQVLWMQNTGFVYDRQNLGKVMDFINDAIGSLDAFANVYKPAAIYFSYPVEISYGNEEVLTSLARLHDSLLPSLQQEFAHIFTQRIDGSQNLFGWTSSDICLRFKLLSVRIVKLGWKLFESCYFCEEQFKFVSLLVSANKMFPANVEDPTVRGDILVQMFREINGDSSHLSSTNSRTFLQNLEKDYELLRQQQQGASTAQR